MPSHPDKSNNDPFCTTRWTVVLAARGDSPEAMAALRSLCEAYYEPVQVHLTRIARDEGAARELAHEFFEDLLRGNRLSHVRREGGRFRAYLSGALRHFVSHRREFDRRLRRGGGKEHVSLQSDTASGLGLVDEATRSPDLAFDQAWATTVLTRAIAALEAEYESEGLIDDFRQLKPWLTGDAGHGAQVQLARDLELSASALKSAVFRLRRRFRRLVKNEVAATLSGPADVEEEMRALFAALSARHG